MSRRFSEDGGRLSGACCRTPRRAGALATGGRGPRRCTTGPACDMGRTSRVLAGR